MKKLAGIVLSFILIFALCACEVVDGVKLPPLPTPTESAPEASAAPSEAPQETEAPAETEAERHVIVSMARTKKEEYDPQNGTMRILDFSYDTPVVFIEGADEAAAKINEFTSMLDEAYYTGESYGDGAGTGYMNMLTMAEDYYNLHVSEEIEGGMEPLNCSRTVSVTRADENALTLLYNDYSYTGGAHGSYVSRGYVFDTQSGERLALENLTEDYGKLKDFLVDFMAAEAESDADLAGKLTLTEDDSSAVNRSYAELFEPLLRAGSWYFAKEGLVIFSDLYELTDYASGPVAFSVPYEKLEGLIDERWMPAKAEGSAAFRVIAPGEMEDGSTEIVDKLTVDSEGEELYLAAEGAARDVRITGVEYSGAFYETGLKWYCSCMEDSALQLVAAMPEGTPRLKLSWTDADGEHSALISQSGEDGGYALAGEDEIELVG